MAEEKKLKRKVAKHAGLHKYIASGGNPKDYKRDNPTKK